MNTCTAHARKKAAFRLMENFNGPGLDDKNVLSQLEVRANNCNGELEELFQWDNCWLTVPTPRCGVSDKLCLKNMECCTWPNFSDVLPGRSWAYIIYNGR